MLKSNSLMFAPWQLAEDYALNSIVERAVAELVGEWAGESPWDFVHGPRTSHDWTYGGPDEQHQIRVELKTTEKVEFPVELFKDAAGLVKSGIAATEADVVLVLSSGRGYIAPGEKQGPDVGKLRAFFPKALLAATKGREPLKYSKGTNATEDAYVVSVDLRYVRHWHLADVPQLLASDGVTWMYDLANIIPAKGVDTRIRALFAEIREGKQQ